MYKLRPYQQESVLATIQHFKKQKTPAVIVLPTGAGKSLVIAEIARIARGRVLVLAHVKELVEQNHAKYISYQLEAGIYSAGLNKKDKSEKVIFGSIQSVARAEHSFFTDFSMIIVDECHRISLNEDSQYLQVIRQIQQNNPQVCIIGLTATPYRLGMGWIYEYNYRGILQTNEPRFFKKCIFELPLSFMIKNKFLTPPIKIDAPVACYDFSTLQRRGDSGMFSLSDIESLLQEQKRITPGIISHIIQMSEDRQGVMIFTSTIRHAEEIMELLPKESSAIVIGDTSHVDRDQIIENFKAKKIKYLVNVSVLTTGFDAPHVDLIAILRPTESVSLYQQIVGRGLRLYPNKVDCLVLDYTGLGHNIFSPEIEEIKPNQDSVEVEVECPECQHKNIFWGIVDGDGDIIEHYGRKCKGAIEDPITLKITPCVYRFRFKICEQCGNENDIAARICQSCQATIVDTDAKLKEAMSLKNAHVMKPDEMYFVKSYNKQKSPRLEVQYFDLDGNCLKEYFSLENPTQQKAFYYNFSRMHTRLAGAKIEVKGVDDAIAKLHLFRKPSFVIAHKKEYYWQIREKIFM